jgi:hypothetical protein
MMEFRIMDLIGFIMLKGMEPERIPNSERNVHLEEQVRLKTQSYT